MHYMSKAIKCKHIPTCQARAIFFKCTDKKRRNIGGYKCQVYEPEEKDYPNKKVIEKITGYIEEANKNAEYAKSLGFDCSANCSEAMAFAYKLCLKLLQQS